MVGERQENTKWRSMQIRDYSLNKASGVMPERNTETNQENKPTSSRFDVAKSSDVLFSVLCVSSTWLVKKRRKKKGKKKYSLPSDFYVLFIFETHFCIDIQLLDFHF